ncbi:MAG: AraC family transcriptional regulator [Chthoniobacteraceae bacterium]|nr:AraC family transcriptional regulator [Chthoniobacteraceae bacterium]
MNAPKLIQSPLNPGWLIPEGWEQILGVQIDYRLGPSILHLWRVQWNQHVGTAEEAQPHTHAYHQLLYYQRGAGELAASGERYEVTKGSIFVVPAGCPHHFLGRQGESPALCLALDFTVAESGTLDWSGEENEAAVLLSLIHTTQARPFDLNPLDQGQVDGCITAIIEENDRRELGYASMIHAHLIRLLSLCLRATQRARGFGEHFRHTAWRHALIADRAQALIRERATQAGEDLTLPETARACATSPNQLNRILKRATGSTFHQILLRHRLDHAAALLRSGQANCTEAAFAAGFNDSNYFARAFRKVFGHTPSALGREEPHSIP